MLKSYLTKIIAKDSQGLQVISAYCTESKVKIHNIKYLSKNKIFLLSLERIKKEDNKKNIKINSICKFEFVDSVRSKNINQKNIDSELNLLAIDLFKKEKIDDINLIFSNNAYISLSTEIVEVTLEDQK